MNNPITPQQQFVYVIHAIGTNRIKLGFSKNPEKRLTELQTGSAFQLRMLARWPGDRAREDRLHRHMSQFRKVGEWFEVPPFCGLKIWELATTGEVTQSLKKARSKAAQKTYAKFTAATPVIVKKSWKNKRGRSPMAAFKRVLPPLKPKSYWDVTPCNNGFYLKLRWLNDAGKYSCFTFRSFFRDEIKELASLSFRKQRERVLARILTELKEKDREDLTSLYR